MSRLLTETELEEIKEYIQDGLFIDGSHHKQWCFYKLAEFFGMTKEYESEEFLEEYGEVDRGISP